MNNYRIDIGEYYKDDKAIQQINVHLPPNIMFLSSFNLGIYENMLYERTSILFKINRSYIIILVTIIRHAVIVISRNGTIFLVCSLL